MTEGLRTTAITHAYPARSPRGLPRTAAMYSLTDASFAVRAGETVGLVGRSGSGKSTLLRVLLALERPLRGVVHLDGEAIRPAGPRRLRRFRRRVQYIPQDPAGSLEPRMTVDQLVREPLRRLSVAGDHRAQVAEALDSVGLPRTLLARRPRELSGGQAQRVAIARAIVTAPDFLLADEPVSGLDLPMRNQVLDLLSHLASAQNLGLVFVSHDLEAVGRVCGRSVVLAGGRVVEDGPTARLLASPVAPATRELVASIPRLHRR